MLWSLYTYKPICTPFFLVKKNITLKKYNYFTKCFLSDVIKETFGFIPWITVSSTLYPPLINYNKGAKKNSCWNKSCQTLITKVDRVIRLVLSNSSSSWAFQVVLAVKNLPANAGDTGSISGSGRSLEEHKTGQSTQVFLPGEFHGQSSLAGYSP